MFHFFPLPINEKFKMAATDKQNSSFLYIITNNEYKNSKSMSFVVSNPWERARISYFDERNIDYTKL